MIKDQIAKDIDSIKSKNLFRELKVIEGIQGNRVLVKDKWLINFASNDYLGLSQNQKIKKSIIEGIREFGAGSSASHLVSGHFTSHDAVEKKMARLLGFERSLFFSSGYMANMSVLGGLVKRSDAVFCDKLNHASLNDSAVLSRAKIYRYNHLDLNMLEKQIKRSQEKNKWIITDGVFSMDGDTANIEGLLDLCKEYEAYLFIDDAHGYGVIGKNGQGILSNNNLHKYTQNDLERIIYMHTLGKAVGISGAMVSAKKNIIELLIQKSKSYIYTTASSPALAKGVLTSLDIIYNGDLLRNKLKKNIELFRDLIINKSLLQDSLTPIQPLIIGNPKKTINISKVLMNEGFYVPAIRPPTVPNNTSRLRVSLSALNSKKDILQLTQIINREIKKDE